MVHIDKPIMDKVRNLSIHVKNKFLPYGIILLVVGGIGIFYDDRSSVPIKEEEKLEEASSPPLCSAPKKENICDNCGSELVIRDDDKPETVKKRLDVYHKQTQPLIDYYDNEKILASVDGTKDMEEVFLDIIAVLG